MATEHTHTIDENRTDDDRKKSIEPNPLYNPSGTLAEPVAEKPVKEEQERPDEI
jgi:hypothetical protein